MHRRRHGHRHDHRARLIARRRFSHEPDQLSFRNRRRRHRARDLGHAGPVDERDQRRGRRRARPDRRQDRERRSDQRRRLHLRQGWLRGGRGPDDARDRRQGIRAPRQGRRQGRGDARLRRRDEAIVARLPPPRNLRQTGRRRDQRRVHGRRFRTGAGVPLSHRRRYGQGARRTAGDQGRALSRRRRHAARRAADADAGRAADAAQGRSDPPGRGEEDGPRARGRAGRSDRRARQGLGEGEPERQGAVGRPEVQASFRQGFFAPGHDDLAAGQRHLSPRNLRQLSRGQGGPDVRVRGPATADGPRARRREQAFRQHPVVEGSRGDDPFALPVDGRTEQGRAPPGQRSADELAQGRRARRGPDGRRHRLRFGATPDSMSC